MKSVMRRGVSRYGHLAFVLPGLLVFAAFKLYPMAAAFPMSMMEWTGLGNATRFVGLDNFTRALQDRDVYRALGHNATFFVAILIFQHTVGLFLAVQLHARPRFMEVYRTILFLPVILSLVATGFIWTLMLSPNIGIVNPLLEHLGLGFLARPWLDDVSWALPSVIVVQAWNSLGWAIVIYLSGLAGVPAELREAAVIDGASPWQAFWRVVFPMLAPSFTSLTVITFIQNTRVFDVVYVLTGPFGAPAGRTDVLGTLIYRTAFGASSMDSSDLRMSYAIAISVLMFLFMLACITLILKILRRREVEA